MRCPQPLDSLLCADEVVAALGTLVRPPACVVAGDASQICRWRAAAGGRGALTLTLVTGHLAMHTVCVERRLGRPVAAVGDECYLRAGRVCVVRRGGRALKLVLSGSRAPDPAAAVLALARLAADRLTRLPVQGGLPGHPEQAR